MSTWRPTVGERSATIGSLGLRGSEHPLAWTSTPSHSRWEWNDTDWEEQGYAGDPWRSEDPWSQADNMGVSGRSTDGWMTDQQMRGFNVTQAHHTVAGADGPGEVDMQKVKVGLVGASRNLMTGIGPRKMVQSLLRNSMSPALMGNLSMMIWGRRQGPTSARSRFGSVARRCLPINEAWLFTTS